MKKRKINKKIKKSLPLRIYTKKLKKRELLLSLEEYSKLYFFLARL